MIKVPLAKARQLFQEGRTIYIAPKGHDGYALSLVISKHFKTLEDALQDFLKNNPIYESANLQYFVNPREVKVRFSGLYWLIEDVRSGTLLNRYALTSAGKLVKFVNSRLLKVLNRGYLMPRYRQGLLF
ncbi:MAG: hypothetical protein JJU28_24720 [Cyclobacteriaceae bacterium]|nr:hypothetical protein [Cyclobacteriaceae bacterium]